MISAAMALAFAANPAHAVLERMGPVSKAPSIGGFPTWFQDTTGVALEFCNPTSQAELDGGWCTLIPPGPTFPEAFPDPFFIEHFYYDATNVLKDAASGMNARLTLAVEASFANGTTVVDGDQVTFGRQRLFIRNLPFAGTYRVITPFSDDTYPNKQVGDKLFITKDVGLACVGTFECTLGTGIGPYLLPSPQAGGAEVPPMPDLITAPAGTDPFYDALVAIGGASADPGTGKQYLADPKRIGAVTGSPLPNFIDSTGASRNHNTFRIEVSDAAGVVFYTIEGENNFTVNGRLVSGTLPGNVKTTRASYTADATGNVIDLDAFATAAPTTQARLPAQPVVAAVTPVLSFYDVPCGGAITVNPDGTTTVNPPPYTAPAGVSHSMNVTGSDIWGQSQPGGLPPSHVCVVDSTARNAAGQVVPAYYLQQVTDDVLISTATYNGPDNGTLTVNATSSDPTAVLTLDGYGPAAAGSPGSSVGVGAGTGLTLSAGAATVTTLLAPPARVQVSSDKGGSDREKTVTARGPATMVGVPVANNDALTMFEDCSATAAAICAAGASPVIDLIANDTVLLNGTQQTIRSVVANNLAAVVVTATAPRLGTATITPDGIVTYTPNANANGTDSISYTVSVNGIVSNTGLLGITITPVNDIPVAGNVSANAVVSRLNQANLLTTSTDPDGNADVKDAVIVSWPAQLGPQPVPANGVINFTPSSTGNFSVTYRVKDAAGALSANTATAAIAVIGSESISYTKDIFTRGNQGGNASARWTVSGTDTVREGQTITIAYNNGTLRATGQSCNGTATVAACVVGTAVVDATGAWLYDKVLAPGGATDPTDTTTWSSLPSQTKAFSSSPVLGGSNVSGITLK